MSSFEPMADNTILARVKCKRQFKPTWNLLDIRPARNGAHDIQTIEIRLRSTARSDLLKTSANKNTNFLHLVISSRIPPWVIATTEKEWVNFLHKMWGIYGLRMAIHSFPIIQASHQKNPPNPGLKWLIPERKAIDFNSTLYTYKSSVKWRIGWYWWFLSKTSLQLLAYAYSHLKHPVSLSICNGGFRIVYVICGWFEAARTDHTISP